MMKPRYELLDDDELRKVIRAVLRGQTHKRRRMSQAEAQVEVDAAVAWAASVRVQQALLEMVEAGELDLMHDENGKLCVVPSKIRPPQVPRPFSMN